jgi:hypothetical protein
MRLSGTLRATAAIWLLLPACRAAPIDPASDGDRPPRRLQEPPAEFPTVFTVIRGVMALPDGRLVVSDPGENRLSLIDFANGTSRLLGRVGEGPREFQRAAGLYRAPGGGVWLFDHELRRLLPIKPSGTLQDVIVLPFGGLAGSGVARWPDDLTFDSLGHIYDRFGGTRFNGTMYRLMRRRIGAPADTVTELLKPVEKGIQARSNGTGTYQEVLFSPQDAWAAAPDGWVAVVRAAPYRVEWFPPGGGRVSGPIIAHKPVRITQAEKELIASGAAGLRGRTTVSVGLVGPGGRSAPGRSTLPEPIPVEELLFAKVKTPVNLRQERWPAIDERGRLWVERSLPFAVKTRVFDVFDRGGNLVDRVELPAGSVLVGFDSQWIYTRRRDADDFEHLQRFPLPP